MAESLQNTVYQFHLHMTDCSKRLNSYFLFNNNVFHLLILHKFILSCVNYGRTGASYGTVLLPTLIPKSGHFWCLKLEAIYYYWYFYRCSEHLQLPSNQWWPNNMRYFYYLLGGRIWERNKNLSHDSKPLDQDLKWGTKKCEAGMLTTQPKNLVPWWVEVSQYLTSIV